MDSDLVRTLEVDGKFYRYYHLPSLGPRFQRLPYALRVLLEGVLRQSKEDSKAKGDVWANSVERLLQFRDHEGVELLFPPGRVVLQDFTGVPALLDLAALRDRMGGHIDSACPADLVVDHSVQLDYSQIQAAVQNAREKREKEQEQAESEKEKETLERQMSDMSFQQQAHMAPPPTVIVHHSAFAPPPQHCAYAYPAAPMQVYAQPPPPQQNYFAMSPYPSFVPAAPPQVTVPLPEQIVMPVPKAAAEIPEDNPGLPLQDEVCPFHQRHSYWADMLKKSQTAEFERNRERFAFLKWVDSAFPNITVIPPGTGALHQLNLEYLARIVVCQKENNTLSPDSLVGTDGHTTMVNGLGVLGWGVGTLDAEAVMFGHPITMTLPKVVGCRISGKVPAYATSTEVVLLVTKRLRQATSVVQPGCFVEFFGPGVSELSVADRATIANMCPEYGALIGFFPTDELTLQYLAHTGRDSTQVKVMREYLSAVGLLRSSNPEELVPDYSAVIDVDLSSVQPCVSGPKRTKDKVPVSNVVTDFRATLTAAEGVRGFGLTPEQTHAQFSVDADGALHTVQHGAVLMAAIASCSNTSNPSVMLGAGLLAKKAIEAGLSVAKYIKTSLSPGGGVVTSYLQESGVMPYLHMLGFEVVGYGCSTCADNAKPLPSPITEATRHGNLVCCGVLSGNRNFEGRIQPDIKANYLASPMLVIAYAIAGRIDIDFSREPIGYSSNDEKPIFLQDVWPTREEVQKVEQRFVIPAVFRKVHDGINYGNKNWAGLEPPSDDQTFIWDESSTFIRSPQYIAELHETLSASAQSQLEGMRCLLKLGDNISSDHISPAGSITRTSPAAEYLSGLGLVPRDFHSYGARRGNFEVMMRGTFAHVRLSNSLASKVGPYTTHFPSEVPTSVFEAAQRYKKEDVPLFIVAGENFGRGAARDWATKGPLLLGVRAVLAVSFNPQYRANLIKTGILPVQIDRTTYEILTGREKVDIVLEERTTKDGQTSLDRRVTLMLNDGGFELNAEAKLENSYEEKLFLDGGVIKQTMAKTRATVS